MPDSQALVPCVPCADLVNSLNKLGYYNRKFMTLMASLDSGKGGLQPAVA